MGHGARGTGIGVAVTESRTPVVRPARCPFRAKPHALRRLRSLLDAHPELYVFPREPHFLERSGIGIRYPLRPSPPATMAASATFERTRKALGAEATVRRATALDRGREWGRGKGSRAAESVRGHYREKPLDILRFEAPGQPPDRQRCRRRWFQALLALWLALRWLEPRKRHRAPPFRGEKG